MKLKYLADLNLIIDNLIHNMRYKSCKMSMLMIALFMIKTTVTKLLNI